MLMPMLEYAIRIIVFMGSKKQMVRIAAGRIVALVTNLKSGWYFPKMNFPRQSVGVMLWLSRFYRNASIPSGLDISFPWPAVLSFFNSLPKLFFKRFISMASIGIPKSASALWAICGIENNCHPLVSASSAFLRIYSVSHKQFIASVERETFGGTPPAMKNCFCRSTGNVPILYQNIAVMSI